MKPTKTLITLSLTILTLAALLTTAAARNLKFASLPWRATWTSFELSGGFGTMRCALTLEGSLRSATVAKARGAEIGSITNASIGACPAGSATVLKETLPWRLRYASFGGTLPNITSTATNIIGFAFRITEPLFSVSCLARSTESSPATSLFNLNASGAVTSVRLGGSIPCEGVTLGFGGTSTTNSAQTITLI